jgi:hypothetical protein
LAGRWITEYEDPGVPIKRSARFNSNATTRLLRPHAHVVPGPGRRASELVTRQSSVRPRIPLLTIAILWRDMDRKNAQAGGGGWFWRLLFLLVSSDRHRWWMTEHPACSEFARRMFEFYFPSAIDGRLRFQISTINAIIFIRDLEIYRPISSKAFGSAEITPGRNLAIGRSVRQIKRRQWADLICWVLDRPRGSPTSIRKETVKGGELGKTSISAWAYVVHLCVGVHSATAAQ